MYIRIIIKNKNHRHTTYNVLLLFSVEVLYECILKEKDSKCNAQYAIKIKYE